MTVAKSKPKPGGVGEPAATRTLFDTSVLVSALVMGHDNNLVASMLLEECLRGERKLLVSTHALAETYSTLTVLPVSPRIAPVEAENLLQENVLSVAEVVTLDGEDYTSVLKKLAKAGIVGGAVYDALHIAAANKARADELVTFNGRDFRRMPPDPPCRLILL